MSRRPRREPKVTTTRESMRISISATAAEFDEWWDQDALTERRDAAAASLAKSLEPARDKRDEKKIAEHQAEVDAWKAVIEAECIHRGKGRSYVVETTPRALLVLARALHEMWEMRAEFEDTAENVAAARACRTAAERIHKRVASQLNKSTRVSRRKAYEETLPEPGDVINVLEGVMWKTVKVLTVEKASMSIWRIRYERKNSRTSTPRGFLYLPTQSNSVRMTDLSIPPCAKCEAHECACKDANK